MTPVFIAAIDIGAGGWMIRAPSGVPIEGARGEVFGVVGISGQASIEEEACAIAGTEAAALTPLASA